MAVTSSSTIAGPSSMPSAHANTSAPDRASSRSRARAGTPREARPLLPLSGTASRSGLGRTGQGPPKAVAQRRAQRALDAAARARRLRLARKGGAPAQAPARSAAPGLRQVRRDSRRSQRPCCRNNASSRRFAGRRITATGVAPPPATKSKRCYPASSAILRPSRAICRSSRYSTPSSGSNPTTSRTHATTSRHA